jgi:hypothetical protein
MRESPRGSRWAGYGKVAWGVRAIYRLRRLVPRALQLRLYPAAPASVRAELVALAAGGGGRSRSRSAAGRSSALAAREAALARASPPRRPRATSRPCGSRARELQEDGLEKEIARLGRAARPARDAGLLRSTRSWRAPAKGGLADFGPFAWRDGLGALRLGRRQADLNEVGLGVLASWVHRRLVNRLQVVDFAKRHPEIRERASRGR